MPGNSSDTPAALDHADLSVLRELVRARDPATVPLLAVRTGLGRTRVEEALRSLDERRIAFGLGNGRARLWIPTNSHPISAAARVLFAPDGREAGAVHRAFRAAMEVRGRRRKLETVLDVFRVARFAWVSPSGGAAR